MTDTEYEAMARAVLALFAAQPTVAQVKAEAWDEGHRAGMEDRSDYGTGGCGPDWWDCTCPNPYRIESEG